MFKRDIVEVYPTFPVNINNLRAVEEGTQTSRAQWRWRLLDGHNHQVVANSAEWYVDKGHTIAQARKRNRFARLVVVDTVQKAAR